MKKQFNIRKYTWLVLAVLTNKYSTAQVPEACREYVYCDVCSETDRNVAKFTAENNKYSFSQGKDETYRVRQGLSRDSVIWILDSLMKDRNSLVGLCVQWDTLSVQVNFEKLILKNKSELKYLELANAWVDESCIARIKHLQMLILFNSIKDGIHLSTLLTKSKESIEVVHFHSGYISWNQNFVKLCPRLSQVVLASDSIEGIRWDDINSKYDALIIRSKNFGLTRPFPVIDSLGHFGFQLEAMDTTSIDILVTHLKGKVDVLHLDVHKALTKEEQTLLFLFLEDCRWFELTMFQGLEVQLIDAVKKNFSSQLYNIRSFDNWIRVSKKT